MAIICAAVATMPICVVHCRPVTGLRLVHFLSRCPEYKPSIAFKVKLLGPDAHYLMSNRAVKGGLPARATAAMPLGPLASCL